MSVEAQIIAWGVAVCAPFVLNLTQRRYIDAIGLSGMMVLIWALGRVLWTLMGPPACLSLNPVIDGCAGAVAFTAWATQKANWKLCLCGLYVAQCAGHFDFWLGWPEQTDLYSYIALNNTLFAGQILCVSYPGVSDVVKMAVRRMSSRANTVHPVGAKP